MDLKGVVKKWKEGGFKKIITLAGPDISRRTEFWSIVIHTIMYLSIFTCSFQCPGLLFETRDPLAMPRRLLPPSQPFMSSRTRPCTAQGSAILSACMRHIARMFCAKCVSLFHSIVGRTECVAAPLHAKHWHARSNGRRSRRITRRSTWNVRPQPLRPLCQGAHTRLHAARAGQL